MAGPKKALITGITGQDGAYLARFLLSKDYEVSGLYRRTSSPNFWRLQALDVIDRVRMVPGDVTDSAALAQAIQSVQPDEVYNLAAQSFVGASFDSPISTGDVDGLTVPRILEILRNYHPETRYYQASSSEVFGNSYDGSRAMDETTATDPASPYAAAKLYAQHMTRTYREGYGMYAVSGILFNHESPLRGLEFVTRKISDGAARIKLGLADTINLGNLDSKRDWGYAPEYVEAMWLMLQQPTPDDYVIATEEAHSVREFAEASFSALGLSAGDHIVMDSEMLRPIDVNHLVGDPSKAREQLGWRHKVGFAELAELMVLQDLERWERHLRGEIFAWDAPNALRDSSVSGREAPAQTRRSDA